MKCSRLVGPACLFVALGAVGCSQSSDSKPAADAEGTAAVSVAKHVHGTGPNGGVVFDFGGRHAEFTVDHGKHEVTVLVLGDDEKTPTAVTADELILNILETKTADGTVVSPMTITLSPVDAKDGKASQFVGSDPGIGNVADFAGTVSGELDGKPAQGEFEE